MRGDEAVGLKKQIQQFAPPGTDEIVDVSFVLRLPTAAIEACRGILFPL
jgi:hypothetical protein